jgi:hypothetical protein
MANSDLLSIRENASKKNLVSLFEQSCGSNKFVRTVVDTYGGSRQAQVDTSVFQVDLRRTAYLRARFAALGCRGFSYKFCSDMTGFPYRLRKRINLRVALVADSALFYPPKVRCYLPRHRNNHYFAYESPAIAFALGIATRRTWYLCVLQSDLVRTGPAAVREHFRGWRKILFANVISYALESAESLCLCREEDVLRACHEDYSRFSSPPMNWRSIYSGTAAFFGMTGVDLRRRINIQLYDRKPPTYARRLYSLDLSRISSESLWMHGGNGNEA